MEQAEVSVKENNFETKSDFTDVMRFHKQYSRAKHVSSIIEDFTQSDDRLETDGVNTCVACVAVGEGKAVLTHSLTTNALRNVDRFLATIPEQVKKILVVGAAPLNKQNDRSKELWNEVKARFDKYRSKNPNADIQMHKLENPKLAVSIGVNARTNSIDTLVV